jgi:hypothetical protein
MVYGDEREFQGDTSGGKIQQKQQSAARTIEAQRQNQAITQQRQNAPSQVIRGSPQDIQIRAEEMQAQQQRIVQENFHQKGSSSDIFQAQREAALQSGKFDYSKVQSSFYTPPSSFINPKGQTEQRVFNPPVQEPRPEQARQSIRETPRIIQPSVKPEQARIAYKSPIGPPDKRESLIQQLAASQGLAATVTGTKSGEVSSFLKFPFAGKKAQGENIPSTSLIDVAIFLPVPLGIAEKAGALFKGTYSFLLKEFSPETKAAISVVKVIPEKEISKIGIKDIGTNIIKPSERPIKASSQIRDFNRIVEATKGKEPTRVQQVKADRIMSRVFVNENISLGRGTGKMVSKGGRSTFDITGTGKPPRETAKPREKTVSVGKGLEQIVRQKEVKVQQTKTVQDILQEQMQKEKVKTVKPKSEFEKLMEKREQKQKQIQKQEQKTMQKTKQKQKTVQELKEEQIAILVRTRQKQKQEEQQYVPLFEQKQEQSGLLVSAKPKRIISTTGFPTLIPSVPEIPTLSSPTQEQTSGKTEPPSDKKRLFDIFGLSGSLTGGGGRGEGNSTTKTFRGNVPINDIVGIYKRSEISYSEKVIRSKDKESSDALGKFVRLRGKVRIL